MWWPPRPALLMSTMLIVLALLIVSSRFARLRVGPVGLVGSAAKLAMLAMLATGAFVGSAVCRNNKVVEAGVVSATCSHVWPRVPVRPRRDSQVRAPARPPTKSASGKLKLPAVF